MSLQICIEGRHGTNAFPSWSPNHEQNPARVCVPKLGKSFLAAKLIDFRFDENRIVGKNLLNLFRFNFVLGDVRNIMPVPIESALIARHLFTLYAQYQPSNRDPVEASKSTGVKTGRHRRFDYRLVPVITVALTHVQNGGGPST